MKILFINHTAERCGVADYGRRLFDILQPRMDITASDTEREGYDIILYNYHYATCQPRKMEVPQIALFHEAHLQFEFTKVISIQDLPRPLMEGIELREPINVIPMIGSFGFGFPDKGYTRICQLVKEQYTKAVVNLNIPYAEFGDKDGVLARAEAEKCREVLRGTMISLQVQHQFWSRLHMVRWLSQNDINLFLYQPSHGRGISSTIDYALSARRPIGVSNSEMFRHLPAEICVDNISIPELIAKGIEPLRNIYQDNSNEKLIAKIKELIG